MTERHTSDVRSTLITPTVYDTALRGEPLQQPVRQPVIDTRDAFWRVGGWDVDLPPSPPRPVPEATRLITLIRDRTGWSGRRLAEILPVSHTTVRRLAAGQQPVSSHSGDLPLRLRDAYDVIDRIYLLLARDPRATARALDCAPPGRNSPREELRAGHPADAYLAAIDALRPPRVPGLLTGDRPRREDATAPLHE
jgi:transcriptional regulator with XRE-family HTH domain